MKKIITHKQNHTADALLVLLQTNITLDREAVPSLTSPTAPEGYADVKSGLTRIAESSIDPARSEAHRTGADDVARELFELLSAAHNRGFPFHNLGATLDYEQALVLHRSNQAQYLRGAESKASAIALAVQEWADDLSAVLTLKQAVGLEVMQEAGEALNKTIAATALDLMARDKLTSSGAAGLPVLSAGRGLMQLRAAGIAVEVLAIEDIEQLLALAGLSIIPEALPGYGLATAELEFRAGDSLVKVDQRAAVLYRLADTSQGRSMLPHSVLAAVSAKALGAVQDEIDERLQRTAHKFAEQGAGNSSLDASRRRMHGGGLHAFAETMK